MIYDCMFSLHFKNLHILIVAYIPILQQEEDRLRDIREETAAQQWRDQEPTTQSAHREQPKTSEPPVMEARF